MWVDVFTLVWWLAIVQKVLPAALHFLAIWGHRKLQLNLGWNLLAPTNTTTRAIQTTARTTMTTRTTTSPTLNILAALP